MIGAPTTTGARAGSTALAASLIPSLAPGITWDLPTAAAAALVALPVFLQAPWVRQAPFSATVFTAVLLAIGVVLGLQPRRSLQTAGSLLVGFSGSWLAGSLFWGWCRLHPLWHLPIEAFALPLALAGLRSRWQLACALYLGSLLGTAATDLAIALTGLMPLWPQVLAAPPAEAPLLLQLAAEQLLQPPALALLAAAATLLLAASARLSRLGPAGQVASSALATTLVVDGLFLIAALLSPHLSGLI